MSRDSFTVAFLNHRAKQKGSVNHQGEATQSSESGRHLWLIFRSRFAGKSCLIDSNFLVSLAVDLKEVIFVL